MILQLHSNNMFNSDKVKNNEVQGYLFFTPMSRSGAFFFALALGWLKVGKKSRKLAL